MALSTAQKNAEQRVQNPGRNRHAQRIVNEGKEQILTDIAHGLAAAAPPCDPAQIALTRVTPALCIATSVPPPIAIPTSACASAGTSLMPSPAMATIWPFPGAP